MLIRHVSRLLSAYHAGELNPNQADMVADHLQRCPHCRRQYDAIRSTAALVSSLPHVSAPDHLWNRIEASLQTPTADNYGKFLPRSARPRMTRRSRTLICTAPIFVAIVLLAIRHVIRPLPIQVMVVDSRPFWKVARLNGAPMVGTKVMGKTGRLKVGEWLQTDDHSRVRLESPDIGSVEVEPNTRLQLLAAHAQEHRLSLAHGVIQARVTAPPRLFYVETPSAVAVDLGCAYTLTVDDKSGAGLLRVTMGYVALQRKGRETKVPSGAACKTRPGIGPGTPFFTDASVKFREALDQIDFGAGGDSALSVVLSQARECDTLTLWYLIPRVEGIEREQVYRRLAAMVPPPKGVRREGVLRLDPSMLEKWKAEVETVW